jgi:hypothetical protein
MANKAVFGIAKSESQAIMIADNLKAAGFSEGDVSVLFPDKKGTKDFAHEQNTKAPEGAATGAAGGAVLGGALGWMVGIGALAIPGLGPFIAAGPIMAAWRVRPAAPQPEALPERSSAWAFPSMRRNATRERSKTETSCSPFIQRTAMSAIARKKSSRTAGPWIFLTPVRLLSPRSGSPPFAR